MPPACWLARCVQSSVCFVAVTNFAAHHHRIHSHPRIIVSDARATWIASSSLSMTKRGRLVATRVCTPNITDQDDSRFHQPTKAAPGEIQSAYDDEGETTWAPRARAFIPSMDTVKQGPNSSCPDFHARQPYASAFKRKNRPSTPASPITFTVCGNQAEATPSKRQSLWAHPAPNPIP